jgi:hypothetical protein
VGVDNGGGSAANDERECQKRSGRDHQAVAASGFGTRRHGDSSPSAVSDRLGVIVRAIRMRDAAEDDKDKKRGSALFNIRVNARRWWGLAVHATPSRLVY